MQTTRDQRQEIGIQNWIRAGHKGTLEWTTGMGKTRAAILAINLLRRNDKTRKVIVVVPGIQLKLQWESVLQQNNQLEHTEVIVINTAIMQYRKCSMLIIDEIHRAAANTFSLIFKKITYSFILGLTATLQRLDSRHTLLVEFAPICDVITTEEARRNRWIAQMREYNLGITMSESEREEYEGMKAKFQNYFDKFDGSFELLKKCSGSSSPRKHYFQDTNRVVYFESECVKRAKQLGWSGNTAQQAYNIMQSNAELPVSERRSVWGGNLSHPYHPEKLHIFAINAMRLMGKMKHFCYKLPSKIDAAEEIIRACDMKYITFAQIVETADELSRRLGDQAVVYHTSLKSKIIDGVKISPLKQKKQALEKYAANEVRGVLTAKALDEGADFPDVELGISTSFTSSPQQRTQRNGRIGRLHFYADGNEKEAMMIYMYAKDTKEYYWLRNAQKKDPRTKWVNSVREILIMEGLIPQDEQAIGFGF